MTDHKNTNDNTTQELYKLQFTRDIYLKEWTSFGDKEHNLHELSILSKISNVYFPLTSSSHLKTDLELLLLTFPRFTIDFKFNSQAPSLNGRGQYKNGQIYGFIPQQDIEGEE